MNLSFFSFRYLTILLQLNLYLSLSGVRPSFGFRLQKIRRLPFEIQIFIYVVVQLLFSLFICSVARSFFLLLMDELSRAVAQFYPTLGGNGGLGGMNGGFNPPPAPDNSSLLAAVAAASTEAGPSASEPNSHVLSEAQERLERLRQENRLRLQKNEKLLKIAEAGLQRLEESFEAIKERDAHRDEQARMQRQELFTLQGEVNRLIRFRK
uniref:Uncharacterized protein n=1 Tax=Ammopiptanthus mongolicus TaxID=126911 RepID=A0A4P8PFQ7_AMMMO|nr:hypothetical protein [Ammopiptanthus mongolicus]